MKRYKITYKVKGSSTSNTYELESDTFVGSILEFENQTVFKEESIIKIERL